MLSIDFITTVFISFPCRVTAHEELIKQLVQRTPLPKLPFHSSIEISPNDWTVIQRRIDGSVNFNRNWPDYKNGFGNQNGEFFIGLDKLHQLTAFQPYELRITLKDTRDNTRYANYNKFVIGDENEEYKLKELGSYSGDAGNCLSKNLGNKFSTVDNDNKYRCACTTQGAWWFTEDVDCGER